MNEFSIISKYLKPLSKKNVSSLNLSDDIFYENKKKIAISLDTYVQDVHFISSDPKFFLKKIIRSSLSDLYCKGVKPNSYFLSFSINKNLATDNWLKKVNLILKSEQKKFNIMLAGGDTTKSTKLTITIVVLGNCKNKPVLRKGCKPNDDIYVTGNIGDSFVGLCILKKKFNFGKLNKFFLKSFYEPSLPTKLQPHLYKVAKSSIDISDGMLQDLSHLCSFNKLGAVIDLKSIPLSTQCKSLINNNKINIRDIFSQGDDYQFLFTSDLANRNKIKKLSKRLNIKITKIGKINKNKLICFKYKNEIFDASSIKKGYTHSF
jgi:thiamine-monophosphate kinase